MEKDLTVESLTQTVILMSIETWRFRKVFERLIQRLGPLEKARYAGQFSWFNQKIKDALTSGGIRLVDMEGQEYDARMAVNPINLNEFTIHDRLVIAQTLEPVVMNGSIILKTGTVVLKKKENS